MQSYIINCTLPCIGATCAQSFARWNSALYGHRYAVAAQRAPQAHCCEISSLVCSALCKHKNISCMAKLSADNVHSCSALSLHGMQDLHSSAQASQLTQQELHNVTGNTSESSSAYTAYPNADLQNYLDLEPPAGTSCCMLGAANVSAVEKFAMSKKGLCCVFYSDLTSIGVRHSCDALSDAYMHLVSDQASHAWQVGMVACTVLHVFTAQHDWLKDTYDINWMSNSQDNCANTVSRL